MKPALSKGVPVLLASLSILTSRSPSKLRSILSKLSLLPDGEEPKVLPVRTQCNYTVFQELGKIPLLGPALGDKLNLYF